MVEQGAVKQEVFDQSIIKKTITQYEEHLKKEAAKTSTTTPVVIPENPVAMSGSITPPANGGSVPVSGGGAVSGGGSASAGGSSSSSGGGGGAVPTPTPLPPTPDPVTPVSLYLPKINNVEMPNAHQIVIQFNKNDKVNVNSVSDLTHYLVEKKYGDKAAFTVYSATYDAAAHTITLWVETLPQATIMTVTLDKGHNTIENTGNFGSVGEKSGASTFNTRASSIRRLY